jgi:hypothetical protein
MGADLLEREKPDRVRGVDRGTSIRIDGTRVACAAWCLRPAPRGSPMASLGAMHAPRRGRSKLPWRDRVEAVALPGSRRGGHRAARCRAWSSRREVHARAATHRRRGERRRRRSPRSSSWSRSEPERAFLNDKSRSRRSGPLRTSTNSIPTDFASRRARPGRHHLARRCRQPRRQPRWSCTSRAATRHEPFLHVAT